MEMSRAVRRRLLIGLLAVVCFGAGVAAEYAVSHRSSGRARAHNMVYRALQAGYGAAATR
jgi:hypothetical protein